MGSKDINIALFLTTTLVFFGFAMAQAPGPQAPTCPRNSTELQACAFGHINSHFNLVLQSKPCCRVLSGLGASVASVCICDAAKLAGLHPEQTKSNLWLLHICGISLKSGFRCAKDPGPQAPPPPPQAPAPQAPTCPRNSTELQACSFGAITSRFNLFLQSKPCCRVLSGLGASVASVCICDAAKLSAPYSNLTNLHLSLLHICRLSSKAAPKCG